VSTLFAPVAPDLASQHKRGLGPALAVIAAAQLMVMLDLTIVNIALPSIQRELDFSSTNLAWVIDAYVLVFGGLLLLGGRTGDLFGRRRMFVVGVALFTSASLAGGLATTQAWLIAARAVQGAGAAIASPTALALVATTFPDGPARHRAMAVYAGMSGAGGALGLLLGGILVDVSTWRWVLFVNVPIGAALVAAAPLVLPRTVGRRGRLDVPGALTASGGMALLVYGLVRAPDTGWSATPTIASFAGAAALLAAGIAGALLVEGYDAARPLGVTVSGVVLRSTPFGTLPASGGRVVLTDDSGTERSLTLGAHGEFRFIEIPAGAIQINATLAGYAPQVLVTFVSAIYSAGPTTGLTFVLAPGGPGNTSTDTVSPFLNLAGLIATFGATAVLILGGAVVAAVAARHTYRDGRRPIGIAGGAAVLLAPVAILLTGVAQVAPLLWLASGPLAGLGAYVVAARLTEAVRLGDPPEI